MSSKISRAFLLVLAASVCVGCATSDPYYPSASPGWVGPPITTDAPSIDNADAAGLASVPGVHTGAAPVIVAPAPAAASPVIVVPPAQPR
jgi:hypothetical protein